MRFLIFVQSSLRSMFDAIRALQGEFEGRALLWTATTIDDDGEIEAFVEGIPGYSTSGTNKGALMDLLPSWRPSPLGRQLKRLLMTCIPEDTARFLTDVYFAYFVQHVRLPNMALELTAICQLLFRLAPPDLVHDFKLPRMSSKLEKDRWPGQSGAKPPSGILDF